MFEPKQLGSRIKSLRVQKNLSQDKLAEMAWLNGKYLGEVERGKANISILNLSKLAEVLSVPLLSLLSTSHERNRDEILPELHELIDKANDSQLKTIYRLIEAITR